MPTTTMATLVAKMREYIEDKGEFVIRNVIGMPDGTRTKFMLHHNYVDSGGVACTVNGESKTITVSGNKVTFSAAPALNSAIIAEYTYYEYSTDVLEQCIEAGIGYLENAIDLGWSDIMSSGTWSVDCSYSIEDIVLTAAVVEFLQMQIVRMPIALSFGDIGSRISFRGASSERIKSIEALRKSAADKVNKQLETDIDFSIVTW